MANKNDFDYMSILHSQIQMIDRTISSESTMKEKYKNVSNYFNAVDESNLDESDLEIIISNMRECLLKAYINKLREVNKDINVPDNLLYELERKSKNGKQ